MILIRGGCDAMRVDEQRLAGVAIPGGPPGLHGRSLWEEAAEPLQVHAAAGERPATLRCDQGFRIKSSNRRTRQVDQVPHTETFTDLPQPGAGGCKEAAQQSIATEPLQPFLPTVGATPHN